MSAPPDRCIQSVHIERRGGFAGLVARAECRYADLSVAQRAAVDQLAATAATRGAPAASADRFTFCVQLLQADGERHTVTLPEDAMPDALAALAKPGFPQG